MPGRLLKFIQTLFYVELKRNKKITENKNNGKLTRAKRTETLTRERHTSRNWVIQKNSRDFGEFWANLQTFISRNKGINFTRVNLSCENH